MGLFHWENIEGEPPQDHGFRQDEISADTATGWSNRWLAVLVLFAMEVMLFVIFIAAIVILRMGGSPWPPPGVPRLELFFPTLNLIVLLTSALLVYSAERSIHQYRITTAEKRLLLAGGLGLVFLGGQLREYAMLFLQGITLSTNLYGSLFYLTLGFHSVHVLTGIVWLVAVWYLTRDARQTPDHHLGVQAAVLYWGLVASVWIILFLLLYML